MKYLHIVLEARTQSLLEKDKMTGQLGSKIIYNSMSDGEILELIKTCGDSSRIFFSLTYVTLISIVTLMEAFDFLAI